MYGAFHQMALHIDILWPNSLGWDVHVGFENGKKACFLGSKIL